MRILKNKNRMSLWIRAEMDNLHAISQFVKNWLASHEAYRESPEKSYLVELAVVEACTNVIRHAALPQSADTLGISMKRAEDAIEILILDRGAPFDPTQAPPPDLDEPREGGYGIFLVHSIMHKVCYRRRGNRWNILHMFHDPSAPVKGSEGETNRSSGERGAGQEPGYDRAGKSGG